MRRQCWCQKIPVIIWKSQCLAQDTSLWAIHQGDQRHSRGLLPLGHVPCWLAFIVFGGAVQAAGEGRHQWLHPVPGPARCNTGSSLPCWLAYHQLIVWTTHKTTMCLEGDFLLRSYQEIYSASTCDYFPSKYLHSRSSRLTSLFVCMFLKKRH